MHPASLNLNLYNSVAEYLSYNKGLIVQSSLCNYDFCCVNYSHTIYASTVCSKLIDLTSLISVYKAKWSRGMIPALGAGGPGFKSQFGP